MKRFKGALRAGVSICDSKLHGALAAGANLAWVVFLLIARGVGAQTLEVVHSFGAAAGASYSRVVLAPDGSFYGTTSEGGLFGRGSIFRLEPDPPNGYTLVEIHAFYGPDGRNPRAGLLLFGDGYLYGTTSGGGAAGGGTFFRTDLSGNVTVLHDIDLPEGVIPTTDLVAPGDGFLYGTTTVGGPDGPTGGGTIFRADTSGHIVVLYQFPLLFGFNDAASLSVGPANTLYGTHAADADHPQGSVFRLESDGTLTTLHTFTPTGPKFPRGSLLAASDGFFYGTTIAGGAEDNGSIFRIDASGGFSIVHEFGVGNRGAVGQLVEASPGNFLGVAGSVFLAGSDGSFANIHSFTGENHSPAAGFANGNDGFYYSTTSEGSSGTFGSVYRIDPAGNFLEVASFTNAGGTHPQAGVFQATDGNLYGASAEGGTDNLGAVYRINAADSFDVIHGYSHDEGGSPVASFVQGPDGALYGANLAGGPADAGTLVRVDPTTEALTVLHSFVGTDGQAPAASLLAIGGLLYGSTLGGGAASSGTLFRIDSLGALDTLWDFVGPQSGSPRVPLLSGSDGLLYGIDSYSLFRYSEVNGVENLHTFQESDGLGPSALIERSPGIFLGTNQSAGEHAEGTLFRSDAQGTITVLHPFNGSDGAAPGGALAAATDGNVYGSTPVGGDNNFGVVYRLSAKDVFEAIHHFDGPGGANPVGGLYENADGALYGVTYAGGAADAGTVYRILLSAAGPVVTAVEPSSGLANGGASVIVRGLHFQPGPALSVGPVTVPSAVGVDSRTLLARMPPLTPGTTSDLLVTNPDMTTVTLPRGWFADFLDVDTNHPFHDAIESVARNGITAGCGGGNYCGTAPVSRAQMAVFLLKAEHGSDFVPPSCTGLFDDVPCPGGFAVDWIEQLSLEGITGGCGGANYCPSDPVRRDQMAVFLLKASQGSSYIPPAATGTVFADVPVSAFAADWIEDLYSRNVTGGCLTNPLRYCPGNTNNRQQMAVFITKTFGLQ